MNRVKNFIGAMREKGVRTVKRAVPVSSIGQLLLLWGVFEWATALNSQDGTMQSMAFKRIASGLVACLAPQIVTVISASLK